MRQTNPSLRRLSVLAKGGDLMTSGDYAEVAFNGQGSGAKPRSAALDGALCGLMKVATVPVVQPGRRHYYSWTMDIAPAQPAGRQVVETGEFAPVSMIDGDPASGFVILCDHAGNALPASYGDLGLAEAEFSRHIAYDPGAAAVSRALAARLGAPLVMANFSRLLIDANRGVDDPTLIMRLSDRTIIPGNAAVDVSERERRIARFHAPYHAAVDAAIEMAIAAGAIPALVSLHSFTPVWRGSRRAWHAGILWDADPRLAGPLIAALRADADLVIGDNEPYSGTLANDSMHRHGTRRGLAHALVEIRQDLIGDETGSKIWAERLADGLAMIGRRSELHEIRHHGSRAGPVDAV